MPRIILEDTPQNYVRGLLLFKPRSPFTRQFLKGIQAAAAVKLVRRFPAPITNDSGMVAFEHHGMSTAGPDERKNDVVKKYSVGSVLMLLMQ